MSITINVPEERYNELLEQEKQLQNLVQKFKHNETVTIAGESLYGDRGFTFYIRSTSKEVINYLINNHALKNNQKLRTRNLELNKWLTEARNKTWWQVLTGK